jgi:hypothetical protein
VHVVVLENDRFAAVEVVAEQPVEVVAEQPVEVVAEQPVEVVAEQPVEVVAEQPVETVGEAEEAHLRGEFAEAVDNRIADCTRPCWGTPRLRPHLLQRPPEVVQQDVPRPFEGCRQNSLAQGEQQSTDYYDHSGLVNKWPLNWLAELGPPRLGRRPCHYSNAVAVVGHGLVVADLEAERLIGLFDTTPPGGGWCWPTWEVEAVL